MATPHSANPALIYPIARIPMSRPFVWLGMGWDDLLHHRAASLAWGALVSGLGALMLAYQRHPYFVAAMTSGFLLVGPIITAGLCELSRCRDEGQAANFESSLAPLRRNRHSLMDFAQVLLLVSLLWFALSASILYWAVGDIAPTVATTVWGDVVRELSTGQLLLYIGSGAVLASIVFVVSVVSVPMIIDRHVDASTAMRTSLRVTLLDLPAMLVWAALVVALVGLGFATGLIAMVVIFPVLGHATWHAYRDLVH
jgi:uncharacterized membrane protein